MSKLVFCDIDGTLILDNKEMNPKDIEILKRWQQLGNKIALCTGRNIMECQMVLKTIDIPYDYLVLNNGGHILDKQSTLYEKKISQDIGCSILDITTQFHGLWSYYCNGKETYGYLNGKTYDHRGRGNMEIDGSFYEMYHKAGDFQIIWFHQDNQQMDDALYCLDYIRKRFSDSIEPHVNQHYVDIVPLGCSKGEGIKQLMSLIDDDIEKTYAIGDSYNDISMFESVDVAATFHRAEINVKKHTDCYVDYVYEFLLQSLGESL